MVSGSEGSVRGRCSYGQSLCSCVLMIPTDALDQSEAGRYRKKSQEPPATTTQPKPAPPPTHLPPHDEEQTSVGGEKRWPGAGRQEAGTDTQAAFSRMNWEDGGEGGYVPFLGEGDSSSDSEEDEEFDPRLAGTTVTHQPAPGGGEMFANFGAVFSETEGKVREPTVQNGGVGIKANKPSEPKLIELSFSEAEHHEEHPSQPPPHTQNMPSFAGGQSTDTFGGFDPWKVSNAVETDDILKFGDSDEFSQVSLASEVRTVGAETFKAPKTSSSIQFDPFGPSTGSTGDPMLDIFGATPLQPSPSNPTLSNVGSEQAPHTQLLTPHTHGSLSSKRSSSVPSIHMAPTVQQLNRPLSGTTSTTGFTPILGTIPSRPSNVQPFAATTVHGRTISAPQWAGSGGSSPYYSGTPSPRSSPIPFGSTTTAAQPQQTKPSDPFADLGNVKGMSRPMGKPPQPPASKPGFQPMTSRPTYRVYGAPQQHQQRPAAGLGVGSRERSPSPNFTSVIGGREDRGPRSKTG